MRLIICLTLLWSVSVKAASPFIWGADNMAENSASKGLYFADLKQIITVTANPSSGAGLAAPIGSLALMNDSGAGRVFVKVGAANTAWTDLLNAVSGWSLAGNSGTNPTADYLGTSDSQDLVFRTNATERFRITSGGSYDTTLGLGIVHSDSSGVLSSSAIVNADVDAAAAIDGTKIDPDFGSQNIETTGDLFVSDATISNLTDGLVSSTSGVLSGGAIVDLATQANGTLSLANGGTSKNLTADAGGIVYSDADSLEILAAGTSGYLLKSNGTSAPSWLDPSSILPSVTLQDAYDGGQTIIVGSNIPVSILDSASPSSGDLFRVGNNAADTFYTRINAQGLLASNLYGGNLTSGRVALTGSSGLLTDSSSFTYSGGVLNNTDASSSVYRLTKTGTGAGSFEIAYFGTGAGAFINGASLTNPVYVNQGGNASVQFQTDGNVRFYESILLEETSGGGDYVELSANASMGSSYSLKLPASGPTAVGQIMVHAGSGGLAFTSLNEVNDFDATSFTPSVHPNQSWRHENGGDTISSISLTNLQDGWIVRLINRGSDVLTVPASATGISYQNGTKVLGQGESVTYEYVSALSGLVEVQ